MNIRHAFVLPKHEPLGVGKLVGCRGENAEVEFFDSPFGPKTERRWFKIAELRATKLGLQTRVFWLEKSSGLWRAGRVDGPPIIPELPATARSGIP